jgi:hypothetical protein
MQDAAVRTRIIKSKVETFRGPTLVIWGHLTKCKVYLLDLAGSGDTIRNC